MPCETLSQFQEAYFSGQSNAEGAESALPARYFTQEKYPAGATNICSTASVWLSQRVCHQANLGITGARLPTAFNSMQEL